MLGVRPASCKEKRVTVNPHSIRPGTELVTPGWQSLKLIGFTFPPIPPETDVAMSAWMRSHGRQVTTTRWQMDPETGFHLWQEEAPQLGRSHALWVAETMVRYLKAEELVEVLNRESVAEYIRISFKVRIEERGAGYRVSIVPRRSGEFKREE